MSDEEFADWLRSVPREIPADKVEEIEHRHDVERGAYSPNGLITHCWGEAQH